MRATNEIKKFIKEFEGCRLKAYLCPARVWTIGYGHTGEDVKPGKVITQQEADRLFDNDLKRFEEKLSTLLRELTLPQHQYDALLSFCYNVGLSAFEKSTMLRKLRQGASPDEVATEFARWVNAGGRQLPGLVKRRQREAKIFLKGDYR